jgi:hypothetical protein
MMKLCRGGRRIEFRVPYWVVGIGMVMVEKLRSRGSGSSGDAGPQIGCTARSVQQF